MAANYRYQKDSLAWTPSGGSPASITGVSGISYSQGGSTIDLVADSNELIEAKPLAGISGRVSVTGINQAVAQALALGAGSLTFDIEQVKTGRGAVSGNDKTLTFAGAVLVSVNLEANSGPGGTYTLEFECADNGSGAIFAVT